MSLDKRGICCNFKWIEGEPICDNPGASLCSRGRACCAYCKVYDECIESMKCDTEMLHEGARKLAIGTISSDQYEIIVNKLLKEVI